MKIRKTKSGQAASKQKPWKYEQQMAFLLPYLQERDTLSSIPVDFMQPSTSSAGDYSPTTVATPPISSPTADETTDEVEETEDSHPKPPPTKKKSTDYQSPSAQLMKFMIDSHEKQQKSRATESVNRTPPEKRHPIRNFLDSIGDTIMTFSKMEQHIAKDKIYNIISEMEFEHLVNANSSQSISDRSPSLSPDPSV